MELRYRLARWRRLGAVLVGMCGSAPATGGAELNAPRHLEYRVAWNGIPAAHAAIDITPESDAGKPRYTISATASTNQFVDLFWRFRGDARATLIADTMVPLRFRYERRINSTPTVMWIDFAAGSGRAQSVYVKNMQRKEIDVEANGLVDPITAAFQALNSNVRVGDTLSYRVFTGEVHYRVLLTIRDEDTVVVPAGRFAALRVEPEIIKIKDQERRDTRVRRATIWVTRAPVRTILRIRSEIFAGAITLDLVHLDHPI